ncbi:MAG: hypothetical protein JXA50_09280 [Deltaproteobacteria bacterium]|nr:hypothetical protein [Deltaproteobacteria bacterium]
MKRFIVMMVFGLMLCCVLSGTAVGVTLDSSGTAPELNFAVTNINLKSAGGHPVFNIHLAGTVIYYHSNMPNWPEAAFVVTAFGEYDYNTGIAKERVYATILQSEASVYSLPEDKKYTNVVLQCSHNPWVHGKRYGAQGCQVTEIKKGITQPGIITQYQYPLSSFFMPDQMRPLLVAWEENMLSEPELSDWNPYAPDTGTDKLTIVSPAPYEVIPDTATSFQLALQTNLTTPPQVIEMKWNRMEDTGGWVGDIKVPGTGKLWQSFAGPNMMSWNYFPFTIPISPLFTSSEPTLYQVSVRGAGETTWTSWRQFWIGEPTMPYSAAKSMVKDATKNNQYVYDKFLNFALKQEKALSKAEKAKKPVAVTQKKLTAPEILSPDHNMAFTVSAAPVRIKVEAKHEPGYDVVFEFEHRTSTRSAYKKADVKSIKLRSLRGTSAVEFSTGETGQWRVRAKLDAPGAPWSNWQEFNVNRGALR